jgi:hypothetical protein
MMCSRAICCVDTLFMAYGVGSCFWVLATAGGGLFACPMLAAAVLVSS